MTGIRNFILPITLFIIFSSGFSQEPDVTDFVTLGEKQLYEPRNTLVFIYTDWCRYCAAMKKTTFRDDEVVKALNKDFYYIPFNGESKEDVKFLGNTFQYKATGVKTGSHELAESLGSSKGELAYPTVVILNPEYEIIYQQDSFISAKELILILSTLSEN